MPSLEFDGNRDGNRGRTTANVGEQRRTTSANVKYAADDGERPRTMVDDAATVLKTTKVQAFGGSNPSPSARF